MLKVLSSNEAAAQAAKLARINVAAVYPITPQSQISEDVSKMVAKGELDCDIIEVEGEHSVMSAMTGAAVAGARVFTATSSLGLAYMNEPMMFAAGMRVPMVMVDVTRETSAQRGISTSRQDAASARDCGWLEIDPADGQELLDSILMAYRLSEDPEILLPTLVVSDGFFMSHLYEPVDVPEQEQVDRFLAPVSEKRRTQFSDGKAMQFALTFSGPKYIKYRYQTLNAIDHVKEVFPKVEKEFEEIFGRSYGGMVEEYRTEDAEYLLMTNGSASGMAKNVIDEARAAGLKVGLARIRMFRPYPREEVVRILRGKKAVGVIDRSICLGWNCGHLFQEARAAIACEENMPKMLSFIDGISTMDITREHIELAIGMTIAAGNGEPVQETNWLSWE
jgi:pyruvate ferredoxin oxidoreductase alpha subunit